MVHVACSKSLLALISGTYMLTCVYVCYSCSLEYQSYSSVATRIASTCLLLPVKQEYLTAHVVLADWWVFSHHQHCNSQT